MLFMKVHVAYLGSCVNQSITNFKYTPPSKSVRKKEWILCIEVPCMQNIPLKR